MPEPAASRRGAPIVALLTDFGTRDGYVGAMKGVLLSLAPDARVVDITHDIAAQDVLGGAWALRQSAALFPEGTVFCAVVDPGVGSARAGIVVDDGRRRFVGPDNGLLSWAVEGDGARVFRLERRELWRADVSATFHGRDIFASVAGHLAAGTAEPADCGPAHESWKRLPRVEARLVDGAPPRLEGVVLHVDRYGNLVSSVAASQLAEVGARLDAGARARVRVGAALHARDVGPLRRTFSDVEVGQWVAYIGSVGLLEVAIRDGDAARGGDLGRGAPVVVSFDEDDDSAL